VKEFGWEQGSASGKKKSGSKVDGRLKFCNSILRELFSKKHELIAWPFYEPVDPVALGLPDYFKVITRPMDLNTVRRKLDGKEHETAEDFIEDVRLIFSNCIKYNGPKHEISANALKLSEVFESLVLKVPAKEQTPPPATVEEIKGKGNKRSASQMKGKKAQPEPEDDEEEEDSSSSEESSSESESESSDDEEEDSSAIVGLSKMMQVLSKEIARIHESKGKGKTKKRKRKGGKASEKKSKAKKPRKKAPTRRASSAKKPAAPRARKRVKKVEPQPEEISDDEDVVPMTFEQRKDLSEVVHQLPPAQMNKCIEIMKTREADNIQDGEDIVVDFGKLKDSTLHAVAQYIRQCQGN
jgi:hypothetical protein